MAPGVRIASGLPGRVSPAGDEISGSATELQDMLGVTPEAQ
jgi:hypothetical protein